MESYELLGYAVFKRALLDLYEGYIENYERYGDDILDIGNWRKDEYITRSGNTKVKYTFYPKFGAPRMFGAERVVGYEFADALFFIHSQNLDLFTVWTPDVIIQNVKRMYKQHKGQYISFSISNEEIGGDTGGESDYISYHVHTSSKHRTFYT